MTTQLASHLSSNPLLDSLNPFPRLQWPWEKCFQLPPKLDWRNQAESIPTLTKELLESFGVYSPDMVDALARDESVSPSLIQGFMGATDLGIFAGESGIGKSSLGCQCGLCVASGTPFLGMPVTQGRVLYCDLENPLHSAEDDHKKMRDRMARHLALTEIPKNFLVLAEPPEYRSKFEEIIKAFRPKLTIIDSVRSLEPQATEKPSIVGDFLKWLRGLTHKYKIAIMLCHHLRKESQQFSPPQLDHDLSVIEWFNQVEGPRAWTNQTDVRIAIEAGNENPVALKMKWNRRLEGDSPLISLERHYIEGEEKPLGYNLLQGLSQLDDEGEALFNQLPNTFKYGEAQARLNIHPQKLTRLLGKWRALCLLANPAKGVYVKTV